MAGSTFGTLFKITTWGESHGAGVGVVVDGCPAGLSLCEEDIQMEWTKEKVDYYMEHPKEAEKLAERGHQLVLKKHTFAKRMDKLVQDLSGL